MAVKKAIQMNSVVSADKNDMVILNLDRPRVLRFGHRALKMMGVMTGFSLDKMDENDFDFADLEKIIYCAILQDAKEHGEDLKLEDMESLLDSVEFHEIVTAMNSALAKAFQKTEKEKN